MTQLKIPATLVLVTLATACAIVEPEPPEPPNPYPQLPVQVVEMAASYQDLSSAHLNPTDNCYWYQHGGVVETTPLPLRTPSGAHLCRVEADAASPQPSPIASSGG